MLFELSSAHFYKLVLFPTDRSTNLSDNIFFIRCLLYQIHCLFLYQCHAGTPFRFFQYCSYRNQEFLLQSILSFHNIFQSDIKKSIRAFIIPLPSLVIARYHQETKAVRIQLMGDSKGKSQRKKQKRFLHWLSLMSTIKSHIRKMKNSLLHFGQRRSRNV